MELRMKDSLLKLKKVTQELAEEIHENRLYDSDSVFRLVTTILDYVPVLCEIVSPDYEIIYVNQYTKNYIERMNIKPPKVGEKCFSELFGIDHPCSRCPLQKAMETGNIESSGELVAIPLKWNGTSAVIIIGRTKLETVGGSNDME